MKLYKKDGVELHKFTSPQGTFYKLYIDNKLHSLSKPAVDSKTELKKEDLDDQRD